jgi:hypothetical protein
MYIYAQLLIFFSVLSTISSQGAAMKLVDKNHVVSDPLKKIVSYFSIDSAQPLEKLIQETQQCWLLKKRKQDSLGKTILTQQQRALFADLGMVNAIFPIYKKYDYILLLGGDLPDMNQRISFLDQLLKNGMTAGALIILCSDRPLYDYEKQLTHATNEVQMIQELISDLDVSFWPVITYCQAFGKAAADGSHRRATTEDTVNAWLSQNAACGNCLVISQQPYIGRQHAVMEAYLKDGWTIETVGAALAADFYLEDMLDTLARWLYQEYQNLR